MYCHYHDLLALSYVQSIPLANKYFRDFITHKKKRIYLFTICASKGRKLEKETAMSCAEPERFTPYLFPIAKKKRLK